MDGNKGAFTLSTNPSHSHSIDVSPKESLPSISVIPITNDEPDIEYAPIDVPTTSNAGRIDESDDINEEEEVNVGCTDYLWHGDFHQIAIQMAQSAEEFVRHVWMRGWQVVNHKSLPNWLKDNDFLVRGHRPELNSFKACFKSIFRVHTETGNIWTHLLGCVAFIGIAAYFLSRPSIEVQWQEKVVFAAFFMGAILCMGFSWLFHTVFCHSEKVGRLFNKLDYCGIALLTMGSFVPWLYYSFYCKLSFRVIYLCLILFLGSAAIVVSMFDKFATPQYRPLRAGVFISLGLSGLIPCIHYITIEGFYHAIEKASLGWFSLMAVLYISGAVIYAVRIPERLFPGRFDLWFQSHQIFHVFVVAAAFVHFHGITEIANYRLTTGDCRQSVSII